MSLLQQIRSWWNLRARKQQKTLTPPALEELEARELLSTSPIQLDLGTGFSPVENGYENVPLVAYNLARGYGWDSLSGLRTDTGPGDNALTQDYHYGFMPSTFLVDVPQGTYDVSITLGSEYQSQNGIALEAEGQLITNGISTAPAEHHTETFRVSVTDGQLDLKISHEGNGFPFYAVNAITITEVEETPGIPPPVGPVHVAIVDAQIVEGDNGYHNLSFTVTLSQPSDKAVTVDYATADGVARVANRDYVAKSGTLTFAPGTTEQTIQILVRGDERPETTEDFLVNLTNAVHATLLDSQATGLILNDETEPIILIDESWLQQRGNGSYLLDQSGATYVLNTDFSTPSTAFVVGAADIVLDLNGHVVTYGDHPPTTVVNGGFENGSGQNVPGWDLRYAPNAQIADNTNLLFGDQVLRLSNFNTTQRIFSDPVAIPQAGRDYTATITPANPQANVTVQISIMDAVTGEILATGTSSGAHRGFSAVVNFTPSTTNPVYLIVDVIPKSSSPTSVDLDMATLDLSADYGILATRVWYKQLPGYANLSLEAQQNYRKASNFTVKNGFLLQGQGRAYGSSAVYARSLTGLTIDNVETLVTGMDSRTVEAIYAKGNVAILNSTFREEIPNISNRLRNFATINLVRNQADLTVAGNRILGSPQVGINITHNDDRFSVTVDRNEIRHQGIVTNAYGIVLSAIENFEISNNTILTTSGRGIMVDGYSSQVLANGNIYGNYVDVQESLNREYPTRLEARALRLRNNVDSRGAHRDIHIHDNTFIARTDEGMAQQAFGARISYVNINGHMSNAGIVIEDNIFGAYVATPDPTYRAKALVIDQMDPGIHPTFQNNVLMSNDVSLQLTGPGGDVSDVTLLNHVFSNWRDNQGRPYTAIEAGYWIREIHNVKILSPQFENGADLSIKWVGSGEKDIAIGWLLDITVRDSIGQTVPFAQVTVKDRFGNVVFSGTTDENGSLSNMEIVTRIYQQETSSPYIIRIKNQGPHTVTATANGQSTEEEIQLEGNLSLNLTL